jgi:hypothetical protein
MKTSPLLQQTFAKLLITLCASGLSISAFAADATTSPSPVKKQVKAKPTKIAKADHKKI